MLNGAQMIPPAERRKLESNYSVYIKIGEREYLGKNYKVAIKSFKNVIEENNVKCMYI